MEELNRCKEMNRVEKSRDKIIVMGGYGQVGGYLSESLAKQYPNRVWAVGRNLEKARAFEKSTNGLVKGKACNLADDVQIEHLLEQAQVVIMCFVPKDTSFAKACMKKGVHYIDITPSYKFLKPLEQYDAIAKQNKASMILGVGICPGLTNLMIKDISLQVQKVEKVESTMLLGVGEKYGMDALDWLMDNLHAKIELDGKSGTEEIIPFRGGKKVQFLSRKAQTCYPLDLADQHIIPKTLGIDWVHSRFCYDVNWITKETALMNRLHLLSKGLLLKGIWVAQKMKIGTDDYVLHIKADVRNKEKNEKEEVAFEISGSDNAKMTAYVAAATTVLVLEGKSESGVHYLEDITSLQEILHDQQLSAPLKQIKDSMNLQYGIKTKGVIFK